MKSNFWQRFADAMSGVSISEIEDLRRVRDQARDLPPGQDRILFFSKTVIYLCAIAIACAALIALAKAL
jgi:hypothetical protein